MKDVQHTLTPRQSNYIQAYTRPDSATFGNSYQSARAAGYSHQTARNITHLRPSWLSESIGQIAIIQPDEIMQQLTAIITNGSESTTTRLKAMEMAMKAYSMLTQAKSDTTSRTVNVSIDLGSH